MSIKHHIPSPKIHHMYVSLLGAKVNYMMANPTTFLNINFYYDPDGSFGITWKLPEGTDTKGKIIVAISDCRNYFSDKSGIALLEQFKEVLEPTYSYIRYIATDMDTDIVAVLYSKGEIPLGYFYQGKYYLWEK